jgi:putative sterol carrier protein
MPEGTVATVRDDRPENAPWENLEIKGGEIKMADSVKEIFDAMSGAFNADKAAGMSAVYQWDVTGDGGGKWNAVIADGAITVSEGENDSPNITITVAAQDWLDITNGKLDGQMAFMSGKLKVKGDMSLAMKMKTLFG